MKTGGVLCLAMRPGSLVLEEGTWYFTVEAEAREAVIVAARALDDAERSSKDDLHEWMRCYRVLRETVFALDALTKGDA